MFKAKLIENGEVYTILNVYYDEFLNKTNFLIWHKNKWTWVDAKKFVPPNFEV